LGCLVQDGNEPTLLVGIEVQLIEQVLNDFLPLVLNCNYQDRIIEI
jgi:hypothetical protein